MKPKPRSFQRHAMPVMRSPPPPILPRVGEREGPRRGDRERRGGERSRRGGERLREPIVVA